MFRILDGREYFYQWDIDRKIIVEDASIKQVHFCNKRSDKSLVCQVYELDGLHVADVPNILLQEYWAINVYGYTGDYTRYSDTFKVIERTKPESYVYTETEVLNYNTLLEMIENIEGGNVDLSDYYTKSEVDSAIAAIPQPDLSDYALKSEIPSTSGLATEEYVDNAVANIEIPETDLSGYYTKSEVDNLIPDTSGFALKSEIPNVSNFITMAEVENKGYQTAAQVSALIQTELGVIENGTY